MFHMHYHNLQLGYYIQHINLLGLFQFLLLWWIEQTKIKLESFQNLYVIGKALHTSAST